MKDGDEHVLEEAFLEELREAFVALSQGRFERRLPRNRNRDIQDIIAFLFNLMAEEIGGLFAQRETQRTRMEALIRNATEVLVQMGGGAFDARMHRDYDGSSPDVLAYVVNNAADEVAAMFGELQEKNAALEERASSHAMAEQTAFSTLSAGVGHELNTPLSYASGNLEFVAEELEELQRDGDLGRLMEVLDALRDARDGVRRAAGIAADLKRLAPALGQSRRPEPCDLREVVDSALTMIRNTVQHRARLLCNYEPVPLVRLDRGRIGQVVVNLVQNALQALPVGRPYAENRIEVAVGRGSQRTVALEVRDNGVGIPPENLPRIFDSFFTTRPVGKGTGLGLALCKRMVSDLRGRIDVESTIAIGSVFRVVLPIEENG